MQWERFNLMNGRFFALRHLDGRDFVVRVITVGGEGHDHLRIIRKLSTKSNLVLSNNHILLMEYKIFHEDVLLGIYPMLGWNRRLAMTSLFANSVEDIMYLILQALEAVSFIHGLGIAHRVKFPCVFRLGYLHIFLT